MVAFQGYITSLERAREINLEYWKDYFQSCPEELGSLISNHIEVCDYIRKCNSAEEACAKYVLDNDGEFHGLDVYQQDGDEVFILESCGQIRNTLGEWFPEHRKYFKYHLNDLKPHCEHQEALGWDGKTDIALDRKSCTPIQLEVLDGEIVKELDRKRRHVIDIELSKIEREQERCSAGKCAKGLIDLLRGAGLYMTVFDVDVMRNLKSPWSFDNLLNNRIKSYMIRDDNYRKVYKSVLDYLWNYAKLKVPDEEFRATVFNNGLCAPCPECGYRYGTKWLKRELPQEVVDWFNHL